MNLTILYNHFITPLLKQNHFEIVKQDANLAVFCNDIQQLLLLHSKLLKDLLYESIGTLFSRYGPLFCLYASYAKHFQYVTKLFEKSDKQFQDFINVRCDLIWMMMMMMFRVAQRN